MGVYGMSTTLTKEGVAAIKDLFRGSDDDGNNNNNNNGGNNVTLLENNGSRSSAETVRRNNASENDNAVGRTASWFSWVKRYYVGSDKQDG